MSQEALQKYAQVEGEPLCRCPFDVVALDAAQALLKRHGHYGLLQFIRPVSSGSSNGAWKPRKIKKWQITLSKFLNIASQSLVGSAGLLMQSAVNMKKAEYAGRLCWGHYDTVVSGCGGDLFGRSCKYS